MYAGVDARALDHHRARARLVGVRVTGPVCGLNCDSRGLALVDLDGRVPTKPATVLVRLDAEYAQFVGFAGPTVVMRSFRPHEAGGVLHPFAINRMGWVNQHVLVRREALARMMLGTVVGMLRTTSREWSTWKRILARLESALADRPGARLTLEADSFDQLRDQLEATARVYASIGEPADLLDGSFPRTLTRPERREYRDAVRHARAKGLTPRDLAAVGGA